uniref:Protein SGT1 homolog n=1 Tax=Lilium longiflorum TaxID=4690 RepID=Q49TU9_LILLO|nr:pollen-specific SGT1 [Lilium longiflorum]
MPSIFLSMASQDFEKLAKEAFIDDNFEQAVVTTQALELTPKTAGLFADRAQANMKLNKFSEALNDTNRAIELDPSLSKAFLRKGMALLKLNEYEMAKTTLQAGALLAPGDSRFVGLVKDCDSHIEKTIKLSEDLPISLSPSVDKDNDSFEAPISSTVAVLKPKYRHNYYNSLTEVVITIFAKSIPKENVSVDFGEQILRVDIDVPGEEAYHFQNRLFGKIVPDKCKYTVLSSKIEIRLFKAETITWTSLEFSDRKTISQKNNVFSGRTRPSYPSSKSKIDWDKLEAEVKKEEKEEKLEGEAAMNKIFSDIYKSVDEDTRRAMNKSFVESNGTVLSTNWKEVGSKKVEGSAPEGMEMKKWEY